MSGAGKETDWQTSSENSPSQTSTDNLLAHILFFYLIYKPSKGHKCLTQLETRSEVSERASVCEEGPSIKHILYLQVPAASKKVAPDRSVIRPAFGQDYKQISAACLS